MALQNTENRHDPSISPRGLYPQELKAQSQRDIRTLVFFTRLFTIAKRWKQPEGPSANDWINKIWYMLSMEYYSVLQKKEIVALAGVAQWIECQPASQRVTSSIPSQGT